MITVTMRRYSEKPGFRDLLPSAQCPHGLSPAVECLKDYRTCPCGYAEGLSGPDHPFPAIHYTLEKVTGGVYFFRSRAFEEGYENIQVVEHILYEEG